MTLCSENHDEVCYEGKECPVCKLNRVCESDEERAKKQDERIEELEVQIAELEKENAEMKEIVDLKVARKSW